MYNCISDFDYSFDDKSSTTQCGYWYFVTVHLLIVVNRWQLDQISRIQSLCESFHFIEKGIERVITRLEANKWGRNGR